MTEKIDAERAREMAEIAKQIAEELEKERQRKEMLRRNFFFFVKGLKFGDWPKFDFIKVRLAYPMEMLRIGLDARDWINVMVLGSALGVVLSVFPAYVLTGSLLLTVFFTLLSAALFAYLIFTIPGMMAAKRIEEMERALPLFLSQLVSAYSDLGNMRNALLQVGRTTYGPLGQELREAIVRYESSGEERWAFERLTSRIRSQPLNRTFELVTHSIETGVDVSGALTQIADNTATLLEAQDEKWSRTSITCWMLLAGSVFFLPVFAGIGINVLNLLGRIAQTPIYNQNEMELLTFMLAFYSMVAVVMDAMVVGQIKYNSAKRGLITYFPFAIIVTSIIFILTLKGVGLIVS